jgi:hypothetical protein
MYRVPPAGARWPAVGAPVDRGVRPRPRLLTMRGASRTAPALWLRLARHSRFPLRAAACGVPWLQAAADEDRDTRSSWPRRPDKLDVCHGFLRSGPSELVQRLLVAGPAQPWAWPVHLAWLGCWTTCWQLTVSVRLCRLVAAQFTPKALTLLAFHRIRHARPNVRAKLAPTVWRAGRLAQNGPQALRRTTSVTRRWCSA